MGGLPRPDVPPGPRRELVDALHDLHHRAGWPSLRTLAREAGCSHTTVSAVFSSPRLPSWGTLELVVEAMGGDTACFHVLWLAASRPHATTGTAVLAIAGRRVELASVRRHLETGTGLLLVTGEAGIGKTRLVTTAAGDTDALVATGRCLPLSAEVPLMPVVDVLRTVHTAEDGRGLEEALAGSPPYVRDSLARLLPELGDGAPVAPDDQFARQHLFAAVARVLAQLHRHQALGLVLEDLHWADAATLDLLEHLLAGAPGLPLVGTWRLRDPTVSAAHSAWLARMARLSGTSCLDLDPLTMAETAEQLSLLSGGSTSADRVRRIHDRSRGHPLFTEQLAAQSEDDRRLPTLLTEVLDRSLDGLGPAAGAVAAALGVAGRGLPDAVLHATTGLEQDTLVSALHELDDRHLLAVDGAGNAGLRHPLLAEAARRRLVPCESAEEHRRLAVALASGPDADAAEVAEHWRHAGGLGEELQWRLAAARQAHVRTAPRAESTHLLRALEVARAAEPTATDGFDEIAARLEAFDALELAGRLEEAGRVIGEALLGTDDLDDRTAAEVLRRAAMAEGLLTQDSRAALVLVDRAIDRVEPHGPTQCLVHSLDLRANQLIDLGRYNEALSSLDRAVDVCIALDDTELFFGTSATLAWHLAHLGDLEGALRRVHDAHARLQGPTDPRREAYMAMMHTDALIQHHRPADEVARAAQRALDIGVEQDLDFHILTLVRTNVAEALINTGLIRRAAQVLADIPVSSDYDHWPVRWASALVDIADGRLDDALGQLELMSGSSVPQPFLEKARWTAVIHLWKGQPDRAWTGLVPAIETELDSLTVMDAGPAFATAARAAADLATLGAGGPGIDDLDDTLTELRERAAVDPLGPAPAPVSRRATTATWDAELARCACRDTVRQWTRAATEWDKLRSPHDAGYCRWRAAEVALREGRGTVATRLLERAAHDAREHVPLRAAVARTAATLRLREHRASPQ